MTQLPLRRAATLEGEPLRVALVGGPAERIRDLLERFGHAVAVFPRAAALRGALETGAAYDGVIALASEPALEALERPPVVLLGAETVSLPSVLALFERARRLEAALEERRRAEREVACALVHDLHNPVAAIIGLAEALARGELLSPEGRMELEGLVSAARGAARRIEGLRRPHVESAREAVVPSAELSLRDLVEEALRHTGHPPGLARWEPAESEVTARGDAVGLRRAVEHVLANARLHAGGAVAVGVRIDGPTIAIEVADEGPGGVVEGPGLRLVRAVLEAHGGTLELGPRPNGGLAVRMCWPGVVRQRRLGLAEAVTPVPSATLTVWLVDDDRAILRAMSRLLRHGGHEVRTFERGAEALQALTEGAGAPDVLLCDQDMPGMGGLDVLRRVRTLAPGAARVLFTAYAPGPVVVEAFNQGTVHRYIQKEEGPSAIEACIEALQAERRAHGRLGSGPAREPVRADLETLLSEVKIELHVQPLFVAGPEPRLVACEALMRSRHPGFRGPLEILDAARIYDRELQLQQILSNLSRQLRDRLPPDIDLLVNIDPALLRSTRHLDEGLAPLYPVAKNVVLELTERARLGGDIPWEAAVERLREVGFRVALDDVGAGYNSLGAVAAVRPDVIKLDISLVSGIHRDPRRAELVRLLCDYAARHGMRTVAEGIEDAREAEVCTGLGVGWLQGYHLGRPMPLADLARIHDLALV